jgi:predicted NBD/HSP70 family sugar kinase
MECVASVDAGGTTTRVLLETLVTDEEICRIEVPTRGTNYAAASEEIANTIDTLTKEHAVTLVGAGAGVAGVVKDGVITGAGNLPAWVGHNLQSDLARRLRLPVAVMNDAEAAALGEYTVFKCPLLYIVWGTGIGGAAVLKYGDMVVTHPTEFGHTTINQDSKAQCGCGGFGHLEALASGANIPDQFGGCKAESLSDGQWSSVLQPLAVGIRNLSNLWMDFPVVLGGGISIKQLDPKHGRGRLPELQNMVDEQVSTCSAPRLYVAKHGEDSGLIGAAAAARQLVTA